jgi:hypothetical protein
LEYSIATIFEQLESWRPGEFRYERKDAEGISRVFSVDVHSTHIDSTRNVWLETLVECKYRHDGTKWVFTPRDYDPLFGEDFNDLFVTLDQCCLDRQLNRDLIGSFRAKYPFCGKGIELLPDDANPKTIEQAVQQLRHAVVAKSLSANVHQVDELLGARTPLFVIVPIVVTTAELWRLKPGTTVEDVRSASEIQAIADSHDLLVLYEEPNDTDKRQSVERFHEVLDKAQINTCDESLKRTGNPRFKVFVDQFAANSLSLFVVIRYDRFRGAMANLHKFFKQNAVVKQRMAG